MDKEFFKAYRKAVAKMMEVTVCGSPEQRMHARNELWTLEAKCMDEFKALRAAPPIEITFPINVSPTYSGDTEKQAMCKFCGCSKIIIKHGPYQVECCNCGAEGPVAKTPGEAFERWIS